ncbi:TetR/AcrR family transcriptional regulator [Actinoplanes sp. NPDC026619]|uniref:TetR/AcrR family transcriptional regulator n=1 Tax=Actinoplanes sp. NPDC026619 TaxID=3155798 RepID=UPI0033EEC009
MTSSVSQVVRRRRGEELVGAILDAVISELETSGYTRLSMESVADAAGTGKAALYRRWSSKNELVIAALQHALPSPVKTELTGDLRADVLALLHCIRDAFNTHGPAFQVVKAEAGEILLHRVVSQAVVEPCQELILQALTAAAGRGEVRAAAVSPLVAQTGPALLIHHALTRGTEMSDEFLVAVVDEVVLPVIRP